MDYLYDDIRPVDLEMLAKFKQVRRYKYEYKNEDYISQAHDQH